MFDFKVVDYRTYLSYKTDADDSVLDKTNVALIVAPNNGDAYYNDVTSGIYTAERLYVFNSGYVFEYNPAGDVGRQIYSEADGQLYQVDDTGNIVPVNTISVNGSTFFNSAVFLSAGGVRQLVSTIPDSSLADFGAFVGSVFSCAEDGIYSIQMNVTNIPGSINSCEIFDSLNNLQLANAMSMDINFGCGCSYVGRLQPTQGIIFYIRTDLPGNLNIQFNLSRFA